MTLGSGSPLELADGSYGPHLGAGPLGAGPLAHAWSAPAPGPSGGFFGPSAALEQHPRPMSQMTDRSRRSLESDADMRSSWGSLERSTDVLPWREMQARLQDEHALLQSARRRGHAGGSSDQHEAGGSGAGERGKRGREGQEAEAMRLSTDSLRDSLEMPSCSERQASTIPLRTSMRGHWQQSHLPSSPAAEARARRLPNTQSPAIQRPLSGQVRRARVWP